MKKLTKEQKENRLKRFRKAKDITLYISLALNTLFIICMAVVGCSPKSDDHNNNTTNNLLKNQLVNDVDVVSNQDWQSYDLSNLAIEKINPQNAYYNKKDLVRKSVDYQFSVICGDEIIVGANAIYCDFDLRVSQLTQDLGFVGIAAYESNSDPYTQTPLCVRYFAFGYRGGQVVNLSTYNYWVSNPNIPTPTYNSDNGFYLSYAPTEYNSNIMFDWFIPNFFNPIKYVDLDLSANWSPYALFGSDFYISSTFNGIIKLTGFTQFVSNGHIYDEIYIMVSQAFYFLRDDGSVNHVGADNITTTSYINSVYYHNSYSGAEVQVMSVNSTYVEDHLCIIEHSLTFTNFAYSTIRVFDINLNESAPFFTRFTNYDIFNLQYSYSVTGGSAGFGNVFGLIKTAFNGLASFLAITILPGITIGMLLMLPVVALIVFAIVKVIKK